MLQKITLFCLGISLMGSTSFSQDFSYSVVTVNNATFSNDLLIRTDYGTAYGTPQWESGETEQIPVAYVSGQAARVEAEFTLDCGNIPSTITVRGVGPEGINFPVQTVAVEASGNFTYPAASATSAFEDDIVRRFKPFKIGWDISFDGGSTWHAADTTANTMYVTLNNPMPETSGFKYWHTIYDISCRNADSQSTETDVIAGIWSEFTDQVTLDWEDDSLKYYSPMYTFNTNLQSLLMFHNAQCYTFAQLFLSCIKIQGIVRSNNYVYITPIGNYVCGKPVNRFLVQNWEFTAPSAAGECTYFPYKNTYINIYVPPYTEYNFITEDVVDQPGLPGQCSSNPSSFFNNHQIAYIDGVYYDACYGVSFSSVEDIPYEAFSGWGYRYTIGSTKHCLFTDNMDLSELIDVVSTF
ncbi:MAG: hypothetical protein MI810_17205 [Flavobacteriales bacterium]|nr:hypothetical protein [Flavobacteriales bacterium]